MVDDVERRRREDSRNRENKARLAFAYAKYESTGLGPEQFGDAASFGLTFIEEPFVTTGHTLMALDELGELFDLDPGSKEVPIPHVSSYVVEWERDDRGFYVGAFCACVVSFPYDPLVVLPENIEVIVEHHFSFSAVAIKDVPIDVSI